MLYPFLGGHLSQRWWISIKYSIFWPNIFIFQHKISLSERAFFSEMKISLLGKQLKKKISPKIFLEFFFFPNFLKLCNLMIYCCLMDMDMDMNMNKNVNIIMNMNMIIWRSNIILILGLSIIRDLVVQVNFLTHRTKTPNIG